ncbi:MAG: hypothetical protein JKY93_03080 [Gammaproteobacteria bacterium]|nr:hypothetical protein [Gammaproteobacteria bacterium]
MASIEERQIRNVIGNAALEGIQLTDQEIARLRLVAHDKMTVDDAITEIKAEIAERNKIPEPA